MKYIFRSSESRYHAQHDWLDSYHSFSFADYYDPEWMGFRALRVINEDTIRAKTGFPMHPHQDMEIITFVTCGTLTHQDSLGSNATITPGIIQLMSAGTGIVHSEKNHSSEKTHLFQVWIKPNQEGIKPQYQEKKFSEAFDWQLIADPEKKQDSLLIHSDAQVWFGHFKKDQLIELPTTFPYVWVQLIEGELDISGVKLKNQDAIGISLEPDIKIQIKQDTQLILFSLA